MGKIYDTSKLPQLNELLSQTPPNYVKENYWLRETQDKVDADWDYRPNRVMIEEEKKTGEDEFKPIEVVLQTVKNDTGSTIIAEDWRRVVFRDIFYECPLGRKFRFANNFRLQEDNVNKNIWLVSNKQEGSLTKSVVIVRCNGTLGSEYVDSQGVTKYHYEPVIQTKDLQTVNLFYSETAVSQQAALIAIVQHNKYTKDYYVNQRFVIGYDKIYRIKALSKFYSIHTFIPDDLGTIILYLEVVETSQYDNFTTRIAYNQKDSVVLTTTNSDVNGFDIRLVAPDVIPENLTNTTVVFQPILYRNGVPTTVTVTNTVSLLDTNNEEVSSVIFEKYLSHQQIANSGSNINRFSLQRLQFYAGGPVLVRCVVGADTPGNITGKEISLEFNMTLRGL